MKKQELNAGVLRDNGLRRTARAPRFLSKKLAIIAISE